MANSLFAAYKQETWGDAAGPGHGAVDWEADDIREIFVDAADDTIAINTDADLADIIAGARVHVSGALGSKTAVLSGNTMTMDAADTTHTTVTGDVFENVVLYKHTGTESTSLLLVFFDTATGLPCTPNGGDIVSQYNASGIFNH